MSNLFNFNSGSKEYKLKSGLSGSRELAQSICDTLLVIKNEKEIRHGRRDTYSEYGYYYFYSPIPWTIELFDQFYRDTYNENTNGGRCFGRNRSGDIRDTGIKVSTFGIDNLPPIIDSFTNDLTVYFLNQWIESNGYSHHYFRSKWHDQVQNSFNDSKSFDRLPRLKALLSNDIMKDDDFRNFVFNFNLSVGQVAFARESAIDAFIRCPKVLYTPALDNDRLQNPSSAQSHSDMLSIIKLKSMLTINDWLEDIGIQYKIQHTY